MQYRDFFGACSNNRVAPDAGGTILPGKQQMIFDDWQLRSAGLRVGGDRIVPYGRAFPAGSAPAVRTGRCFVAGGFPEDSECAFRSVEGGENYGKEIRQSFYGKIFLYIFACNQQ